MSEALPQNSLYRALFEAQNEFPPVKKDSRNPHFHSKYASLDGVKEALEPTLRKHNLYIIQPAAGNGIGTGCTTILIHALTGESIRETLLLPSAGPGKTPDAQTGVAAVTYARRVGYLAMLGVSPEDDDDGNSAVGRPQSGQRAEKKQTKTKTKAEKTESQGVVAGDPPPKAEIPSEPLTTVYATEIELANFQNRAKLIKIALETAGAKDAGKKLAKLFLKKANVTELAKIPKLNWESMLKKMEDIIHDPNTIQKAVKLVEEV